MVSPFSGQLGGHCITIKEDVYAEGKVLELVCALRAGEPVPRRPSETPPGPQDGSRSIMLDLKFLEAKVFDNPIFSQAWHQNSFGDKIWPKLM